MSKPITMIQLITRRVTMSLGKAIAVGLPAAAGTELLNLEALGDGWQVGLVAALSRLLVSLIADVRVIADDLADDGRLNKVQALWTKDDEVY